MSYSPYTLEIVSKLPEFNNKTLRKHHVNGQDIVGVYGNEPFEVKFRNNTRDRIQVKISIDGTDILTGDLANTQSSGKMWMVEPYSTLSLSAWPETNNGGASFVFTNHENGVSSNTHGNVSSRGIIAAAVYIEGEPKATRIDYYRHYHNYNYPYYNYPNYLYNLWSNLDSRDLGLSDNDFAFNSTLSCNTSGGSTFDMPECKSTQSLAAVGAGSFVKQDLRNVEGLNKPVFAQAIQVKYEWWDDVVSMLKKQNEQPSYNSGFPGDKNFPNINLGKTPRINTLNGSFKRSTEMTFSRF